MILFTSMALYLMKLSPLRRFCGSIIAGFGAVCSIAYLGVSVGLWPDPQLTPLVIALFSYASVGMGLTMLLE